MSADYTTVGLVANCKRRGFVPSGSGLTTSEILQILTEQLRNYITSFLKGIREEYVIAELDIPITSATIPVPARAVGAALRTIAWRDSGTGLLRRQLSRIEPERRSDFSTAPANGESPWGYMFQGNNIILLPAVTTGTLVVSYQQRPGQLVLPTSCAELVSLNSPDSWNVVSTPSEIQVGTLCDIVSATPNFKLLAADVEVAAVYPTAVHFVDDLPTDLGAGDFICLANETPIAQVPYEVHDLLAQAAALEIAQATGSTRLEAIRTGLTDLRAQVTMILSPRTDGSSRPIVNRSFIGYGRGWW